MAHHVAREVSKPQPTTEYGRVCHILATEITRLTTADRLKCKNSKLKKLIDVNSSNFSKIISHICLPFFKE